LFTHFSKKTKKPFTPLAANRTPNRRRPLRESLNYIEFGERETEERETEIDIESCVRKKRD
jgi:hypothetical protein